jgi:hypothetical protein
MKNYINPTPRLVDASTSALIDTHCETILAQMCAVYTRSEWHREISRVANVDLMPAAVMQVRSNIAALVA